MMFASIPYNSGLAMLSVVAVLAVASLIYLILRRSKPDADFTELWLRLRSWWWMIIVVFVALSLSRTGGIVFVALLSYLALKEYFSIVPVRMIDRRVIFWAYLMIPIQYYWVHQAWYGMFIIFIPVYFYLFISARMLLTGESKGFIRSVGSVHWGSMLAIFSLSHMAYLLVLPVSTSSNAGNIGLVLYLLILTQFNDVAQYVWGKSFGRHKVIVSISPNKTWEGLLGGVLTTATIAAVLAPWLTPMDSLHGLYAGLIIGIGGFFGDLNMSAVKRDLRIKDTGSILPGHGGILDRLDSLTFTAPLFFHYIFYIYY